MDLEHTIRELHTEKENLERVILSLEQLLQVVTGSTVTKASKRGRKSMGPRERQEVSARMKKYWAGRKRNGTAAAAAAESAGSQVR